MRTKQLQTCAPVPHRAPNKPVGGGKLGSWLHFPSVFTVGTGRDRYPILGILKRAPIELRAWGWASDLPWVTRRLSFLVYKRAKLGDQWHLSLSLSLCHQNAIEVVGGYFDPFARAVESICKPSAMVSISHWLLQIPLRCQGK